MAQTTYRDSATGRIYDSAGNYISSLTDYQRRVASGELSGSPLPYSQAPFNRAGQGGGVVLNGVQQAPKSPVATITTKDGVSALNDQKARFDAIMSSYQRPGSTGGVLATNPQTGAQVLTPGSSGLPSPSPIVSPAPTQTSPSNAPSGGTKGTTSIDGTIGPAFSYEEAISMFGTDFTGLHQTADGKFVPDRSAWDRIGIKGIKDNSTPMQNDVTELDNQIETLIKDFNNYNVDTDPAFTAESQQIRDTYSQMRDEMKKTNYQRQQALSTLGYRTGSTQFAGAVQAGIIGEEVKQADKRISDINREENKAIQAARKAYQDGKYTEFSRQVDALDKLRDNKADALKEYNQTLKDAYQRLQDENKFQLDVLKYQLDVKNSSQTNLTKEYNLAKEQGFDGSLLDYMLAQNELTAQQPTSYREWQLAGGQQGTGKTFNDWLTTNTDKGPTSYQEWSLAGGLEGTGKTFAEWLTTGNPSQGPTSYQEWSLAGGLEGTGKTYAEWLAKSTDGVSDKDRTTFLSISNKYQADSVIQAANTANLAKYLAEKIQANPGQAGDQISLLYSYIKLLDPTSAVREGEIGLAQQTQSYFSKFQTSFERLTQGKPISDSAALELARATKDLSGQWFEAAKRRDAQYESQADSLQVGDLWRQYKAGYETPYNQQSGGNLTPLTRSYQSVQALLSERPEYADTLDGIVSELTKQGIEASDENVLQILEYQQSKSPQTFNNVVPDTNKGKKMSMMRTDRHNNLIAAAVRAGSKNEFTNALDKAGIKWTYGDPFADNPSMVTIKVQGNPIEAARQILAHTGAIQNWYINHTGKKVLPKYGVKTNEDFKKLSYAKQQDIIKGIYSSEGGSQLLNLFG